MRVTSFVGREPPPPLPAINKPNAQQYPTGGGQQSGPIRKSSSPQRTYYSPSVYDDDPGIMSEAETSATGFRRNSKVRSSLPVVRTPCKTQERPLGMVFLQYRNETKRAMLPNEITTMDTVKALFVRSFSKQLTMKYLESPHIRIYIHDAAKDMFYELEDLRDVRDRSVLRIYERDLNGSGDAYPAWDQDTSYFSEPEFDSEYQNQHIHRTKNGNGKMPPYYDSPEGYSPGSRPPNPIHGPPMRPYSPSPMERHKITNINYNTQTLPRGTHIIPYTPGPPQSPPENLRKEHLLSPVGTVPPPLKPQRSFQQPLVLTLPPGKPVLPPGPPYHPPPSSTIPAPRPLHPYNLDRRDETQVPYRPPCERVFPPPNQIPFQPIQERRFEPLYQTSPNRDPTAYIASPERRYDMQRPFVPPAYNVPAYEESPYYSGTGEQIYCSRSGSVTPIVDEEARVRVENMERQLATLTGLVQKALTKPAKNSSQQQGKQVPTRDSGSKYRTSDDNDDLSEAKSSKSSSSSSLAEETTTKQERLTAPKMSSKEKSVSFSEETTTVSSPIQKQHSPQSNDKPAKPAIKSSSIKSQSSAESEFVPKSKTKGDRSSGGSKPAPPPKPASLDSKPSINKELKFNPKMCAQLHTLKKQTKDLRVEVRNLRRIAQAQAITAKETVRDACIKIKAMLAALQVEEDQFSGEKFRITREGDVYRQDVSHLEKDLSDLESQVEELRSNVINKKCRVNMSDVEGMALVLSRASKTVADLKARFPGLQEGMKTLMASEMEAVVREEKFLKEEPDRLEIALKRCKKLTGTLVTLKRLASVQEQRNTGGGLSLPERTEGAHSDGEAQPSKGSVDSHTIIHVPPDGHQKANHQDIIESILDDLKSNREQRDIIPGFLGPQRRLPSYPSGDSPVRQPPQKSASLGSTGMETGSSKLHVMRQARTLSPSRSPVLGGGSSPEGVPKLKLDNLPPIPKVIIKKVPPTPPPRTCTSPTTTPTPTASSPNSLSPILRPSSVEVSTTTIPTAKKAPPILRSSSKEKQMPPVSAAQEPGNIVRTSAISDENLRRDSNSSSSESINSQEGLQMALQMQKARLERKASSGENGDISGGRKCTTRQEIMEHRQQELLKKQKQLQEQYARLQQIQRGNQRYSPPRAKSKLGDLKKTGSESNILSKTSLHFSPASGGSMTNVAAAQNNRSKSPVNLTKVTPGPPRLSPNKMFETDIL